MSFAATGVWGDPLSLDLDGLHGYVGPQTWAPVPRLVFTIPCSALWPGPCRAGAVQQFVRLFLRVFLLEFQGDNVLRILVTVVCTWEIVLMFSRCFLSFLQRCVLVCESEAIFIYCGIHLTLKHKILVLYDWIDVSGQVGQYLYKTAG